MQIMTREARQWAGPIYELTTVIELWMAKLVLLPLLTYMLDTGPCSIAAIATVGSPLSQVLCTTN